MYVPIRNYRFVEIRANSTIAVLVACGICNGLAIITTLLRLYFRARRSRLWVDDVCILASLGSLNSIIAN
jgi:hypothetical protein